MNEVHIRVNERGRHQPYRRINGLYALDVGPAFVSPRDAITYAIELEGMPSVSPLRPATRSGDDTTLHAPGTRLAGTPRRRSGSPVEAIPPAPSRD